MSKRYGTDTEHTHWLGYTDIFASSLLILILVTVISAINNANNQKPPLITLTESQSFRFDTGSHKLSQQFKAELDKKIDTMKEDIEKYNIDTIEVIGHTDGQPSNGQGNLDTRLLRFNNSQPHSMSHLRAGSNTDLGLLRALAVANFVKEKLASEKIIVPYLLPYSAGSLINTTGKFQPAGNQSDSKRRRIEIRFTRSNS